MNSFYCNFLLLFFTVSIPFRLLLCTYLAAHVSIVLTVNSNLHLQYVPNPGVDFQDRWLLMEVAG